VGKEGRANIIQGKAGQFHSRRLSQGNQVSNRRKKNQGRAVKSSRGTVSKSMPILEKNQRGGKKRKGEKEAKRFHRTLACNEKGDNENATFFY